MMKNIILFIIVLMTITISAKIPIGEAIEKGIKLNLEIINVDTELKIIKIENKIKRSDKYFRISAGGSYLFRSEKIEIQFPDIMITPDMSIPGQKVEGGTLHNFDLNISLFQPLFTGNVLSNLVRIGDLQQTMNISRREALALLIKGKIKSVFLKHVLLESEKISLELLKKKIDNHLGRLEDLFHEELVGKSQILETKIRSGEISL
ncbi:MAG: TolC family protein, partial [Candidatus Aminicenantes bacterium]|nr:TolC family protein [Candidatus Aminicenantes bacterium]